MRKTCQLCSITMTKTEDFGLEADGNVNSDYCHHCYVKGVLQKNVTLSKLIFDVQKLADIDIEHPGLLSKSLLRYIKKWLSLENNDAKTAKIPNLCTKLLDGQDCDFTGTKWEKEWLLDGKVCHCKACIAARKCISDIKCMGEV